MSESLRTQEWQCCRVWRIVAHVRILRCGYCGEYPELVREPST